MVPVERFTLIGETRRPEHIPSGLRSRFGIVHRFQTYSSQQVQEIVRRQASQLLIEIEDRAASAIAERSDGLPSVALWLLRRMRDFADVTSSGRITKDVVRSALAVIELDECNQQEIVDRRRQMISDETKTFVWQRDKGGCVTCGSRERLEFDHIIPVARGGSNTARNIQLLCEACNRKKGARI